MIALATSRPSRDSGDFYRAGLRTAREIMVLTAASGGAMVVLYRQGASPGQRAAKVAAAYNQILAEAEERHRRYWAEYDAAPRFEYA